VFAIDGRQVKNFQIDTNVFVVEMEEAGLYILETTNADGCVERGKVVIAR
jgi:hypothetical protein